MQPTHEVTFSRTAEVPMDGGGSYRQPTPHAADVPVEMALDDVRRVQRFFGIESRATAMLRVDRGVDVRTEDSVAVTSADYGDGEGGVWTVGQVLRDGSEYLMCELLTPEMYHADAD